MEVQTSICLRYFETTMIVTVHHQFINMKIYKQLSIHWRCSSMVTVIRLLDHGHWSCLGFSGTASSCKGRQRPRSGPKSREMCLMKKRSDAKGLLWRIHMRSHGNICVCVHVSKYVYHVVKRWLQSVGVLTLPHFFLRVPTKREENSIKINLLIISENIMRAKVARSCFRMFREPTFPVHQQFVWRKSQHIQKSPAWSQPRITKPWPLAGDPPKPRQTNKLP